MLDRLRDASTLGAPGITVPAGLAAPLEANPLPAPLAAPAAAASAVPAGLAGSLVADAAEPRRLQLQLQTEAMGPLTLEMTLDGAGHAHLVVQAASEALRQSLGERSPGLVDAMKDLGLSVQVDLGQGGQSASFDGRRQFAGEVAARGAPVTAPTLAPIAPAPRSAPASRDQQLSLYA